MAEITAAMVMKLRERSGLPMMDCKKALQEADGDEEKAMEILRKSGAKAAEKKAGRATSEGRIGCYRDAGNGRAALVEMLCETAPVANNPEFRQLADRIARHAALTGSGDPASIGSEPFIDDPKMTVADLVHDVLNRIRENMVIGRIVRLPAPAAVYVHHTGKLGVGVCTDKPCADTELLNDICMHVAAMQPEALDRAGIPAEKVARETELAREEIRASGKPENMIDRILTGKMNRWFSERVLLEQPFVKDDKTTVGQVLQKAGVTVTGFRRLQVGVE